MFFKIMQVCLTFFLLNGIIEKIWKEDERMDELKFIKDRKNDYNASEFMNELFSASKKLGVLEGKINSYKFNSILIPHFHLKEAVSTMYIEGTQTTINDVYENEISSQKSDDRIMREVKNHSQALLYGSEFLNVNNFSHTFIKQLHKIMLDGIIHKSKNIELGDYKSKDNRIVNSYGKTVFIPPTAAKTKKYMDELIDFMNSDNDGINPLIKAAIIHSQFESIHPFDDGNGRVGRLLVSLYLYKSKVINFPFFYISEAISQDKNVYYNKLTDSRKNNYDEWIKFFLKKCTVQAEKHISYIDSLNRLYERTKKVLNNVLKSTKYELVIECIFTHPVLNSTYLSEKLNVSIGQAKRYLDILENNHILSGDDRKRNRLYYFVDLLDLARRNI